MKRKHLFSIAMTRLERSPRAYCALDPQSIRQRGVGIETLDPRAILRPEPVFGETGAFAGALGSKVWNRGLEAER